MNVSIDLDQVKHLTGDYHTWLLTTLKDNKAACGYVQVALDAYLKNDNSDNKETFLLALQDVLDAQESKFDTVELLMKDLKS